MIQQNKFNKEAGLFHSDQKKDSIARQGKIDRDLKSSIDFTGGSDNFNKKTQSAKKVIEFRSNIQF